MMDTPKKIPRKIIQTEITHNDISTNYVPINREEDKPKIEEPKPPKKNSTKEKRENRPNVDMELFMVKLEVKMKEVIKDLEDRIIKLELQLQTGPKAPDYMIALLKSLLDGEKKRCKNGKWPAKLSNIQAVADYFQIKI